MLVVHYWQYSYSYIATCDCQSLESGKPHSLFSGVVHNSGCFDPVSVPVCVLLDVV